MLTQLQSQLAGVIQLQAQLAITPPSLASSISTVTQLLANLQISVGLPGIDFQITAVAGLITQIQANLGLLLQIQTLLGTAGIFAFTYSGPASDFGKKLADALAGGWPDGTPAGANSNAIVLATTDAATWTAMQAFFGGA